MAPKVLFSALDWGQGHTTRSIPLIQSLREEGAEVIFAGNAGQQQVMLDHFPDIEVLDLPGYEVRYARTGWGFIPKILAQLPRLWKTIQQEKRWLAGLIKQRPIHGVISDNRYGLYHPGVPTVFITHQLRIQTPGGRRVSSWVQRRHHQWMAPFQQRWVVDHPNRHRSLAGELAHPPTLPLNTHYLGWLSAMNSQDRKPIAGQQMVVLSGPEPQRTLLSDLIWDQIEQSPSGRNIWFIEGSRLAKPRVSRWETVEHWTYLSPTQLAEKMEQAERVICRSGYSTIMDLMRLGKPAILIPTPGQTEQGYLGRRLKDLGWCQAYSQSRFHLEEALSAPPIPWPETMQDPSGFDHHKTVVKRWLGLLDQARRS